jgi:hypothetical protein
MTDATTRTAHVASSKTISFGFPYGGPQHAHLVLRNTGDKGDVFIDIPRANIVCFECIVTARFDDKPALRFDAGLPSDHSRNTLFIHEYDRFVRMLLAAKKVRIEMTFYQSGRRVLEFDVAGLRWTTPPEAAPDRPAVTPPPQISCYTAAGGLQGAVFQEFMRDCEATQNSRR